MKKYLFFLSVAIVLTASCTKVYCGGEGVEYVNLQSRIVNNLDETITVSLYMSNQSSIKDLELKQHSFFDLGNFDLNDCDSLDVKFANNKGIRLYSGRYLTVETGIDFDNCFEWYVTSDLSIERKVFDINYHMKSYAK